MGVVAHKSNDAGKRNAKKIGDRLCKQTGRTTENGQSVGSCDSRIVRPVLFR
jgi:hypothetical protein